MANRCLPLFSIIYYDIGLMNQKSFCYQQIKRIFLSYINCYCLPTAVKRKCYLPFLPKRPLLNPYCSSNINGPIIFSTLLSIILAYNLHMHIIITLLIQHLLTLCSPCEDPTNVNVSRLWCSGV
jgi:hypothetical protein